MEGDVRRFATKVIGNLQARFPERPLIKAFEVFNPKKLPQEEQSLVMYGEQEVSLLCEKYSSVVKKEEALVEWEGFAESSCW